MNKIVYSPEAQRDIDSISDYITYNLHNPIAAANTVNGILDKIELLKEFADMGTPFYFTGQRATDYRYISYKNYNIFYTHLQQRIVIQRVLNARQDQMRILFS